MNILQILPQLNVGGVETGTVDLARHLKANGHDCFVVSAGGELVKELEACGVKHYTLPVDNKAFWVMFKAADKLVEIIKKEKIEIVHARSRVPAWVGFMAARRTEATLITTAHGHYSRHIFSPMMGWGKFTIVPSMVIGRHMVEDFGVPRENIRLIPRSVDLKRYALRPFQDRPKKGFVIAVIGRVTPIKGQAYFLKALPRVLKTLGPAKAWIIGGVSPGKDNYMEELEVWTRRLGLAGTVEFLGNRRDIPELLSQVDCLVMPSTAQEAFGRVVVEAQASGVPVVATKVGGVVEIIDDGQDGLLVHPRDPEGLADAIVRVLKDAALARKLIANGRRKVEEKFSLEKMAQDTLAVYREARESPRLLVIKLSAIGDAILATPSLEALKKKFPASRISCLAGKEVREAFARCPYVDELILCDLRDKDRGWRGFWTLAKKLARRRFDAVIDFQNNKKSHLLSYATFSARRYGYDNGKLSFLLNRRIKDPGDPVGPVEHQFRVLEMLGIAYQGEQLQAWPSQDDKKFAERFLKDHGLGEERLVGVNIGASRRWPSKRWPAKNFAGLCDSLSRKGCRVLLTGSPEDASFAREVLKYVGTKPLCSVAQTKLLELASLIERCDAFVTSDSAPLHLAAAVRTPFVALFGPTEAKRHLPPAEHFVVLQKGCAPCYKGLCRKKSHLCMEAISVDEVSQAVDKLLTVAKRA